MTDRNKALAEDPTLICPTRANLMTELTPLIDVPDAVWPINLGGVAEGVRLTTA